MNQKISHIIKVLRLPLMIMVVFIHSYIIHNPAMEYTTTIEDLFSIYLPAVAVPLFMFFSGYLFFVKEKTFSFSFYTSQLKKRFNTLLVPYLLWNTIVIIFFLLLHTFIPQFINPNFENISEFSILQILKCYLNGSGGFPIAYQFWFIRDLMVFVLLTPVIYWLAKMKIIGIVGWLTAFIFIYNSYVELGFYFYLGAYCSINSIDFVKCSKKISGFSITVAIISIIFCFLIENTYSEIVRKLYIISGSVSLISWNKLYSQNGLIKTLNTFASTSFFIFAFHGMIALIMCKFFNAMVYSLNQFLWILIYFFNIFIILFICILVFKVLNHQLPKVLKILTGSRS